MFWERADLFLLIMCLICSFFGIYMVRIATIAMEASGWVDSSVKCVIVQVFSLFLGLGAFVILTFIDADLLAEQWKLLCGINIALLVALNNSYPMYFTIVLVLIGMVIGYLAYPPAIMICCLISIFGVWIIPKLKG